MSKVRGSFRGSVSSRKRIVVLDVAIVVDTVPSPAWTSPTVSSTGWTSPTVSSTGWTGWGGSARARGGRHPLLFLSSLLGILRHLELLFALRLLSSVRLGGLGGGSKLGRLVPRVRHRGGLATLLPLLVDDVDRVRLEDAARARPVVTGLRAAAARAREPGLATPAVSRCGISAAIGQRIVQRDWAGRGAFASRLATARSRDLGGGCLGQRTQGAKYRGTRTHLSSLMLLRYFSRHVW